jgi:hypothetical protein
MFSIHVPYRTVEFLHDVKIRRESNPLLKVHRYLGCDSRVQILADVILLIICREYKNSYILLKVTKMSANIPCAIGNKLKYLHNTSMIYAFR